MTNYFLDNSLITEFLEEALSQPPSKAGLRLKSEEELACILNVGRRRLRNSFSELERKGILVRRRGSGTYLRRLPTSPDSAHSKKILKDGKLSASVLFAEGQTHTSMVDAPGKIGSQQELSLSLWKDWHLTPAIDQAILDGMMKRTNELGHRLNVFSLVSQRNTPLSTEQIRQQLEHSSNDGYIVSARWGDLFKDALTDKNAKLLFYATSTVPIVHAPMIYIDTAEAIKRAVRIFAEYGYKRIGLVCLIASEHMTNLDIQAYKEAMAAADLDYYAVETTEPEVSQSIYATQKLLSMSNPPEAIYVADDFVLGGAAAALRIRHTTPAESVAIISHHNMRNPIPTDCEWSTLQFDLVSFGSRLIDEILLRIQNADQPETNLSVHATWKPARTHIRQPVH